MDTSRLIPSLLVILLAAKLASCTDSAAKPTATAGAASAAQPDPVERGRYLVRVGGCNDCHTPGFMQNGEAVPEGEWLTGVPVGWRGPWGTTYAANLRLSVPAYDAETWIKTVRSRKGLPPMPWASLHAMTDDDLRAVHAYIRRLGVAGAPMPATVPPDQTPQTPWLNLAPVMPDSLPKTANN